MNLKVSVTGKEEIDNVLKGLPNQFTHKILQTAHAQAAKPLIYKEHLLSPVGRTGRLADSIGSVKTPYASAGTIGEVIVGPRKKSGGNVAHLMEFGTVMRQTKSGANRGRVIGRPFIAPSFDQTKGDVIRSIEVELAKSTYAFMRRTIRNA